MRRVSSRQRLVSWDDADTFQANQPPSTVSNEDDDNESYDADLPSASSSSHQSAASKAAQFLVAAMTKKRKRRVVHLIPPEPKSTAAAKPLPTLPQDVWCHVHHFLDKPDLQVMLQANLAHRLLILRHRTLWHEVFLRQWPWIPEEAAFSIPPPRQLLRFAWAPTGPSRIHQLSQQQQNTSNTMGMMMIDQNNAAARYTGTQRGDRCIRADAPLLQSTHGGPVLRPMWNQHTNKLTLGPSLCSYFEITVESSSSSSNDDNTVPHHQHHDQQQDCIAIGIATQNFVLQGRQPGWDTSSYGWHGDDGGLFHGAGSMRKPLESFGPGDTVGCGLWSSSSSGKVRLVFTKNGRYLGAPFVLKASQRRLDWFPVVGIDSPQRVSCNFGARPFAWDFERR